MHTISFDIATLAEGYADGAFTPSDVIREALRRIRKGDPKIWITVDTEERLLAQTRELEGKDIESFPLYGVPFAVKDNIDVDGLPTTAACPDFKYFPPKDAQCVALLRAAGAIPLGKTNLDQFATGLVGTRSPYGAPANAFNPKYISGGSSSGSAVAVALGQAAFGLGTDTAGSGRVPACFNNLVGLKPSRGLISTTGLVPACRSLDCISIFALNGADAQTALASAAKFDPQDAYSRPWPMNLDTPRRVCRRQMTFGAPDPAQLQFFGNSEYQEQYLSAIKRLESLGFTGTIIDFSPFLDAARLLYEGPWVAERYWAIKDLIESSPDSLHPVTRAIIEKGNKPSAVDAFDAMYALQALKQKADAILESVDFLALPTAGTHYTIDEVEQDPITLNSNLGYYTNFMNLLDLSAVAAPTGFTAQGLPFGITLAAPAFHDRKLLAVADRLQQASDLPLGASQARRFPPLEPAPFASVPIVVCGAHLSGLPLNGQLADRGAVLLKACETAPKYRLYALPNTTPPKPGLIRVDEGGVAIAVEIWSLPETQWAAFVSGIPAPLGIGTIELEDGTEAKGFICEGYAVRAARDVSEFGGWRAFLAQGA